MPLSIVILLAVFVLIAVRRIGNLRLEIWQIMLFGALAALLTGQISAAEALMSINLDVMLFLFGMFVVGQALEESGYLAHISYKYFKRVKSVDGLILAILFGMGTASAFLMNDTLAIIGTPVVLLLARKHGISPKVLLLALAFAVTIGSVMSPIGNPQNLLIAVQGGIGNPFLTFFKFLLIPTVVNLFMAYLLLKFFYGEHFHSSSLSHSQEPIRDHKLAVLSKISLLLVVIMVLLKMVVFFVGLGFEFGLTYIALVGMLPVLLSGRRLHILKSIDWHTLIFFAAMFILMESVWDSGFFQTIIDDTGFSISSIGMIFAVGVILSQLISNVPLVTLYLPLLVHAGASTKEMLALAAASTIAGNLSILGAASNVIIVQNAEKKSGETLTFCEFVRVGVPLTVLNVGVYWVFLVLV
ncbi:MAG: SLC13 family permease [Candidatus Altiarchaeota archaeon]